jgi:tripartite-type tricarboxylate transporter receptor subunit TctC
VTRLRLARTVSLALLLSAIAHDTLAQEYPRKPIRLIMPNAPGSSIDFLGRIVAQRLGDALGEQIVVENRAGAGGVIGMEAVKTAAPDGYTLLAASTAAMTIIPHLRGNLPYDPLRDFAFVSTYALTPNALVVNPGLPIVSARELIDYVRARPGATNMASAGPGSQSHLSGVLLMQMTGMASVHVPYKGGGPSVLSVVTGESQWTITPMPAVIGQVKQGQLRLLAHTLPERSPQFPGTPALAETIPGYTFSAWTGLLAPRGTPQPVVEKLRATLVAIAATPEFRDAIANQGAVPQTSTPEEFARLVADEYESMGRAVKTANLKLE